jgi:hypothetical protein
MAMTPVDRDGQPLRKRYARLRDHLFTFLDHPEIAADNNSSERELRPTATYRKVMCGRPVRSKKNLRDGRLRVTGCGHVSGLLCGTRGRGPVWDAGIRSTSLACARSATLAPGSPDPASPALRHTYPTTSSPRRQPHTRRPLMRRRLELDILRPW